MDTHSDGTVTASRHLSSVKDILAKLDEMKNGRVGARERLEFLLSTGSEIIQEFDFRDAFDLEIRTVSERLGKVEMFEEDLRRLRAQWSDGPFDADTKEVGGKLLGHLEPFIRHAKRQERDAEIELLSQLWRWEPDVNPMFGLPSPDYLTKKPSPAVRVAKKAAENVAEKAAKKDLDEAEKIAEMKRALEEEVADENLADMDFPSAEKQTQERGKLDEGVKKTVAPEASHKDLQAHPDHPEHENVVVSEFSSPEYTPVAKVSKESRSEFPTPPAANPPPRPTEKLEEEMDMLDIRSWTEAINDATLGQWKFDRQLRGRIGDMARMGVTLIWSKRDDEMRLDVERLAEDEVLVRIVPPRSTSLRTDEGERMYRVYAREMTVRDLEELHKDPRDFVKKMLR